MSSAPGQVRVGTASWTDRTLTRESDWYPKKSMSAKERLAFYASIFSVVEVDATFYHPPSEQLAHLWAERTPDDFRFDVKAYGLLTGHAVQRDSLWDDIAEALPEEHAGKRRVYLRHLPDDAAARAFEAFGAALAPLEAADKLGAVFFQFPPWFTNNRDNRAYLDRLPERLPGQRIAVEFRHKSWLSERSRDLTLDQLERLGVAYVCVDGPQGFDSSIPPVLAVTQPELSVVRFHGHNADNWEREGLTAAERFRYLYSADELRAWAPRVRELAGAARETHVVFNNCYRDYGVRNAQDMKRLLNS
jgi:uncharacterized protein YecE (DUF72 family)